MLQLLPPGEPPELSRGHPGPDQSVRLLGLQRGDKMTNNCCLLNGICFVALVGCCFKYFCVALHSRLISRFQEEYDRRIVFYSHFKEGTRPELFHTHSGMWFEFLTTCVHRGADIY